MPRVVRSPGDAEASAVQEMLPSESKRACATLEATICLRLVPICSATFLVVPSSAAIAVVSSTDAISTSISDAPRRARCVDFPVAEGLKMERLTADILVAAAYPIH